MRVAIIGAGVSGIAALKCCLEEDLTAVCFEQDETFGGLWVHKDTPVPNETTVTRQVVCNTSKEMMAFSDFPPPQEFPLYMPQNKYKEYLQLYVKNFDLEPHMKFNSKVYKCDYKGNKWWLKVEDLKTNSFREEIFDAVMLCNGRYQKPRWYSYPGLTTFSGQIIHVQQYRKSSDFSGKRVLVIGMGNSASETAVELTRQAEQVYSSTINGKWICKRLTPGGLPADVYFLKRIRSFIMKYLPFRLLPMMFANIVGFNHEFFGLKQKSFPSAQTTTVNDDIVDKISSGNLIIKPGVEKFTANEIFFVDGTVLTDIDVVIFGTGCEVDYPFLDQSMMKVVDHKILVSYKHIFLPEMIDKKLAVIGCINVFGPAGPVHEAQCRFATRVFKGLVKLPPKKEILEEINATMETQSSVDIVSYQDQLYELIGCKPNIRDLLLSDPYLGLNIFFGPFTSYQFRLTGPGKWAGAKTAILGQWKRMHYPTNKHLESELPPWMKDFLTFIAFLLVILILVFVILLSMWFR